MVKTILSIISITAAAAVLAFGQNTNTNSSSQSNRARTTTTKPSATAKPQSTDTEAGPAKTTAVAPSSGVLAAFDKIIEGIRRANVNMVTAPYWNSPNLILFNFNGSVTRGWDQMHKNRASSYPDIKDVKIDVRDKHVIMLGRDGAVVTCLWTQSQTFKGQPDTASGRMTLVFKRVGSEWKAVHLHTSPDQPDASRVPASEQATPQPTP